MYSECLGPPHEYLSCVSPTRGYFSNQHMTLCWLVNFNLANSGDEMVVNLCPYVGFSDLRFFAFVFMVLPSSLDTAPTFQELFSSGNTAATNSDPPAGVVVGRASRKTRGPSPSRKSSVNAQRACRSWPSGACGYQIWLTSAFWGWRGICFAAP